MKETMTEMMMMVAQTMVTPNEQAIAVQFRITQVVRGLTSDKNLLDTAT